MQQMFLCASGWNRWSSCIWILGVNLGKGTGRRTIQYDDIPDDPAPGVGYADSVFGIGVYRSRCRTPAL